MDRLIQVKELLDRSEHQGALRLAGEILIEHPECAAALYGAGQALMREGRLGLAFNLFARAADIEPRAETYNSMGYCLQREEQIPAAKSLFLKAVAMRAGNAMALNNLCSLHVWTAEPAEALRWGRKALEAKPGWDDPAYNMGLAHLFLGNWEAGWKGYEQGLGRNTARGVRRGFGGLPDWDGTPGRRVAVYGEQGLGDEIMFATMVEDAARDCAAVHLECDKRLGGLFKRSFPGLDVRPTRWEAEPAWPRDVFLDAKCASGSLGQFYRRRTAEFPGRAILQADPERRIQWRALLGALAGARLKLGIAWTGGIPQNFERRRSMRLEDLLPVLRVPGVEWVSLQYKDPTAEIGTLEAKHGIKVHHWPRATQTKDYDDAAALVAELDGVVTVCTSVVHLAGGLGVPAEILVPARPMWRYGLIGERMAWWGAHRLHRQQGTGWASAIESVRQAVAARAGG